MGTLDLSILSAYLCAYAFGARCFGHVCACTLLFMCIIVLSVNAFVRHAYSSLCVLCIGAYVFITVLNFTTIL